VEDNSASRPPSDQITLALIYRNVSKSPKIAKRQGAGLPSVESNGWDQRMLEHSFINGHVHRCRTCREIVINVKRGEQPATARGNHA
jgi:hypothetical protein